MFFRRTLRVFYFFTFSFLLVFISSCFRFVRRFYCWLHLLTSLFLHCLLSTSFLCCYRERYGFERAFFTLRQFLFYTPLAQLAIMKTSLGLFCLEGCRASHWGLNYRINPPVYLNHKVFGNYVISRELFSNLSKYVENYLWWRVWQMSNILSKNNIIW